MTTPVDVPVPTIISQNVLIEPDAVRILDRRVFPFEKTWVTCRNHEEVAKAIEDMVTQSSGPLFAAAGGMTLAARDADRLSTAGERRDFMTAAGRRLVDTRRTNNQIRDVVAELLEVTDATLAAGEPLAETVERAALDAGNRYLARSRAHGRARRRADPGRRDGAHPLLGGVLHHRDDGRGPARRASGSTRSAPRPGPTCRAPGSPRRAWPRWACPPG